MQSLPDRVSRQLGARPRKGRPGSAGEGSGRGLVYMTFSPQVQDCPHGPHGSARSQEMVRAWLT